MIKVGDRVDVFDAPYVFGVCNGKYTHKCQGAFQKNLLVIATGLSLRRVGGSSYFIANTLLTDSMGNYWFVHRTDCRLVNHIIVIDGKKIEISHESWENLRTQLLND